MLMVLLANIGIVALFSFVDDDTPNLNTNEYCFAYWTPHGGFWQDECYSDKKTCKEAFVESKSIGRRHNTEKCYKHEQVTAYCITNVKSGKFMQDYDDKEYEVLVNVCTEKLDECRKYEKYSSAFCHKVTDVNTRESEGLYLNSKHDLEDIIKKNKKSNDNKSGCTKYESAPNQQSAFENLGLNWKKTKNWGAFVDVDGNLRANKPSCRLIERGSTEYNKYK